ncbi:hypothetical protein HYX17_05535 [Candidatus Woesearchaeota archaeon]|nr:hypothetical protein [Candidatus Woesearchaeota archaeon]
MTIGKISIIPSKHYKIYHSDVPWPLVITTILSPTKSHPSKRHGKQRFTYIKIFKEHVIEIHAEKDPIEDIITVINAFKIWRKK